MRRVPDTEKTFPKENENLCFGFSVLNRRKEAISIRQIEIAIERKLREPKANETIKARSEEMEKPTAIPAANVSASERKPRKRLQRRNPRRKLEIMKRIAGSIVTPRAEKTQMNFCANFALNEKKEKPYCKGNSRADECPGFLVAVQLFPFGIHVIENHVLPESAVEPALAACAFSHE